MTTIDATLDSHAPGHASGDDNYLRHKTGILSWVASLDHKRIGVMYLGSVIFALFLGGLFALAVRTALFSPLPLDAHGLPDVAKGVISADTYNKFFTLHGAVMVFLFIIPSIPATFGNFVLPVMLGAKDVAFPRMNLASYYCWVVGAACFLWALVAGQVDTGWTFYTPYSTSTQTNVIAVTLGTFILGFSSIFTGLNFIVTMHTMRPPGMNWFRMPLFLWALYATSVIQVLATPVLAITLLLLILEKTLGLGIFNPALGGDPVLFQHFFWFYSHPAVYIMILPAMGVISEVISVHSRKHIFGYRFIAFSSIALALLGFLVWGHHMFTSGVSVMGAMLFSALTFTVAIPSAVKVFNWLTTLYKGSISFDTPMCYALSFIFMFSIGGLTGLFLGALATDIHLHDTYFVVAHFHYVMMGGTLIAFMAALHHWWPKMTGRHYSEPLGRIACGIIFLGFNLTFIPQFVMGSRGMPRRYYDYVPEFTLFHRLSTIGAFTLLVGFLLVAGYLLHSMFFGRRAHMNPWGGASLEWRCASPPPYFNFAQPPKAHDPYEFQGLAYDEQARGYVET